MNLDFPFFQTPAPLVALGLALLGAAWWQRRRHRSRHHRAANTATIASAQLLRHAGRTAEARDQLLLLERRGVNIAPLHYHLACCFSLLGDFFEARARLVKACQMDAEWTTTAMFDPDLKALRQHNAGRGIFPSFQNGTQSGSTGRQAAHGDRPAATRH